MGNCGVLRLFQHGDFKDGESGVVHDSIKGQDD